MKITFAAIVNGQVTGTRTSGTMPYTDAVVTGDDRSPRTWHKSLLAAVKEADRVNRQFPGSRAEVVPAVPINAQGIFRPGGPNDTIWAPLYEAAMAYSAAEMGRKRDAALAEALAEIKAADAEPVDLDAEPIDVIEPVVTMSTDGDVSPADGLARPIMRRTRENMAACAAVGLTYWSDHPRDGFVWAVDGHQTAHTVRIDRKRGLVAVGQYHALVNRVGHPINDDVVSWSIDGPAEPDQTLIDAEPVTVTIDGPAEPEFVPPVETLTAPRLGNLESVNHAITAADMVDALVDSGKLIVGHIGPLVPGIKAPSYVGGYEAQPVDAKPVDAQEADAQEAPPVDVPAAPGLLPADARRTRLGDMVADALATMVDGMSNEDRAALGGTEAVNAQLRAWLRRSGRVLVFKDIEPRTRRR